MSKQKQENKYQKWLLTVQETNNSGLPSVEEVKDFFNFINCQKYIFQQEIGTENRKLHFQAAFISKVRTRHSTLIKQMQEFFNRDPSQFQLNKQAGSWEQNVAYCSKLSDRVGELHCNFQYYDGSDIKFMDSSETRRPFQQDIIEMLLNHDESQFLPADDRSVIYVYDKQGGLGKSKIVKWFTRKFPDQVASFSANTDAQLRSSAIDAGCRNLIFVDLPRATQHQSQNDDKLANIFAVLEELKNGCCSSSFYGKYRTLLCQPAHIMVFSNQPAPVQLLTSDRWCEYVITENFELEARDEINQLLRQRIKDLSL